MGKDEGVLISLAVAQRMLFQRITKDALSLARGQGDPAQMRSSDCRRAEIPS